MSRSEQPQMHIGCPECDAAVTANLPPGPGIDEESDSNRLQGTETVCRNCGHEVELYYY